ncbi:unnamed protein product [marine sediment metagenome]|uniref:Uncharacterized protein n=1 Tax=marine sediment metagenome TaxID=412755 RepID=X0U8A1_9ZZZZ
MIGALLAAQAYEEACRDYAAVAAIFRTDRPLPVYVVECDWVDDYEYADERACDAVVELAHEWSDGEPPNPFIIVGAWSRFIEDMTEVWA